MRGSYTLWPLTSLGTSETLQQARANYPACTSLLKVQTQYQEHPHKAHVHRNLKEIKSTFFWTTSLLPEPVSSTTLWELTRVNIYSILVCILIISKTFSGAVPWNMQGVFPNCWRVRTIQKCTNIILIKSLSLLKERSLNMGTFQSKLLTDP